VLDVGAGTGRDAAEFAPPRPPSVAGEPTTALRGAGLQLHNAALILRLDDHLPALARVRWVRPRLGLVSLTAVWMQPGRIERLPAMEAAADLTA
jgi:hypothetical protein